MFGGGGGGWGGGRAMVESGWNQGSDSVRGFHHQYNVSIQNVPVVSSVLCTEKRIALQMRYFQKKITLFL
jgi:hypothetical protein